MAPWSASRRFEEDRENGYIALRRTSTPVEYGRSVIRQSLPPIIKLIFIALVFTSGTIIGTHYPTWINIYSRRPALNPISLLPPRLTSPVPPLDSSFPFLPPAREEIPNIVHYVYGLDTAHEGDFPYYAYLGMRSALLSLKPRRILFHCLKEPRGYWWDRVKEWGSEEEDGQEGADRLGGLVEVVKTRDPTWVGKDKRPVSSFAHKADILRLEALREYGGIYLDIDTFVLDSFAENGLLTRDMVLAMEAEPTDWEYGFDDDEMRPKGLCNAIIVARNDSQFLQKWLESYDYFDQDVWADHSVKVPWHLAQSFPTEVTVLSDRAFFWPTWSDDHIDAVYHGNEYDFFSSGQLAYHLWESQMKDYLHDLDPLQIWKKDTSFTRMASAFMASGERERWQAHLKALETGSIR